MLNITYLCVFVCVKLLRYVHLYFNYFGTNNASLTNEILAEFKPVHNGYDIVNIRFVNRGTYSNI
jgi:hypothetical protein